MITTSVMKELIASYFNVWIAATEVIKKLNRKDKRKDSVTSGKITSFKRNVYELKIIIDKLFERFHVGPMIICCSHFFDPSKLFTEAVGILKRKFKSLLTKISNLQVEASVAGDKALMSNFQEVVAKSIMINCLLLKGKRIN